VMKKIFFSVIMLSLTVIFSAQVMAQTENKTVAFKHIYNSAQADRILATEIKKKELLQTPSSINNLPSVVAPVRLKESTKKQEKLTYLVSLNIPLNFFDSSCLCTGFADCCASILICIV